LIRVKDEGEKWRSNRSKDPSNPTQREMLKPDSFRDLILIIESNVLIIIILVQ